MLKWSSCHPPPSPANKDSRTAVSIGVICQIYDDMRDIPAAMVRPDILRARSGNASPVQSRQAPATTITNGGKASRSTLLKVITSKKLNFMNLYMKCQLTILS